MAESQTKIENYKNPPIFLAILEIRYKNSELKNIEKLSECKNEVLKLFPNSQKQVVGELKLDNLLEGQPTISQFNRKVDCFLYTSKDKQSEFTISLDRFNYRQSGSYTNFKDFTKNIKTVWKTHHELLKNISIIGISLRFFNKIEIKENIKDPTDFFNISIQAADGVISDLITNYSIRCISRNIEKKKHSIISLSLEPSIESIFPFVLDIDVHDENIFSNDLKNLWDRFEVLRIEKDNLFNRILTEKTKSLFK